MCYLSPTLQHTVHVCYISTLYMLVKACFVLLLLMCRMLLQTGHTDVLKVTTQYCDSGFRSGGFKGEGSSVQAL